MNQPFDIERVTGNGRAQVLRVRGQLDARTAPVLLQKARETREGGHDLVLNLEGVTLIASSGIGALLALAEECGQASCRVRIAAASPAVDSVVRLLNLDQFLILDRDEATALNALAA